MKLCLKLMSDPQKSDTDERESTAQYRRNMKFLWAAEHLQKTIYKSQDA